MEPKQHHLHKEDTTTAHYIEKMRKVKSAAENLVNAGSTAYTQALVKELERLKCKNERGCSRSLKSTWRLFRKEVHK
jgi:hypothetical protein